MASFSFAKCSLVKLLKPPMLHCESCQCCYSFHNMILLFLSPSPANFPGADSVFRVHAPSQTSSADLYSKDWFVFDVELVLPEYIIDFKYLLLVRAHFTTHRISRFLFFTALSRRSASTLHFQSLPPSRRSYILFST